jgi:type I restriction enzyme M protein
MECYGLNIASLRSRRVTFWRRDAAALISLEETMDVTQLENWLWDAACQIRGPIDAPKFKDYILPLVFLRRLGAVFEEEIDRLGGEFQGRKVAEKLVNADHGLVRFYLPKKARWGEIASQTAGLGEILTDAVRSAARENPPLHDVIDVVDFNATSSGQRIVSDDHLRSLIQALGRQPLGTHEVEPDVLGRAYEYLLRKFAEPGASAGEFYTPREVGILMARLIEPQPGARVYDPCCGSGGLLIKCHLRLIERLGIQKNGHKELPSMVAPLRLYGQEINPSTFAIARMNAFIHDMYADIRLGDTLRIPRFTQEGRIERFDIVVANPMWNQDFPQAVYEHDGFERFDYGYPPSSTADWGWLQHMLCSLSDAGRMAVVLDTGAAARGSGTSGTNREHDIRETFVDQDLIEAVVLLPENLFYNTTAPGIIVLINKAKKHPGEVLLINASNLFSKSRPKNLLEEKYISAIADAFENWQSKENFCALVSCSEIASNDYNVLPSRYVTVDGEEEVMPLDDAVVLLAEADEERTLADAELEAVLSRLGLSATGGSA